MNTNNGVKWRRFIVPKKVEQINGYLFIYTYKTNNIKIGVGESFVVVIVWDIVIAVILFKIG